MEMKGGYNELYKNSGGGAEPRLAFTLSEVLIVLGIIGVVSALTIPVLISKYNEKVTITALQKTYSELQQAIKMSETYNGSFRDWNYAVPERTFAETYIMPYLAKQYSHMGYFVFKYKKPDKTEQHPWSNAQYYYNDKSILIRCFQNANGIKYSTMIIDINGTKGPNIMGRDVFNFTLFNYTYGDHAWQTTPLCPMGEHYGLYQGGIGGFWGEHCASLEGVLGEDNVRGSCTKNGSGEACGLAIEKNGWKIPDNYPVRF